METFVICHLAVCHRCKEVGCMHYYPHRVAWKADEVDPEQARPCTNPTYCDVFNQNVMCRLIKEN